MNRLLSSLVVRTVVVALIVSGSASAQTIFVEGSAFAGIERRVTQRVERTTTAPLEAEPTGPELDPKLVGYHTARRRGIQIGYLGGAAFVWRTLRQRAVSSEPSISGGGVVVGPGGQVVPIPTTVTRIDRAFDGTASGYEVGAAVGMDADIAIGSHLSAVPQIRVIGMPNGGLSIRPGVGVRATW